MKSFLTFLACALLGSLTVQGADKHVLLIAGKKSHGPGDHEFRAGCLLLQKCLAGVPGLKVDVQTNDWPTSDAAFDGVDAVIIYSDGGASHPTAKEGRMKLIDNLVSKGVGVGCMHFAVEVPKGTLGEAMWRWIGGYYEDHYSVNPMWVPNCKSFPNHPISRGVKPFALLDEWYFNMRWAEGGPSDASLDGAHRGKPIGVTSILTDRPSDKVRKGPYVYPAGPYDHIVAASGREETMMWAFERPNGGRGFGFTGGHKHVNWSNDNYRKVVLNAILWAAHMEVPERGVESVVKPEELAMNLDPKGQSPTAPDLTGHWSCQVETQAGTGEPSFTFVHAGQNLLGSYKGLLGEATVFGSVNKDQSVKFGFTASRDGQDLSVNYSGKAESSTAMRGKVQLGDLGEGTWTGKKD